MPSRTIFFSVPLSFSLSVSLSRTHQYAPPQPTSTHPASNEHTEKICATKRPTLTIHFYFFGILNSCLISYFLFLFDRHHISIYQIIKHETYSANTATHCNTVQRTATQWTLPDTRCDILQHSFAEYSLFYRARLQKRPIIFLFVWQTLQPMAIKKGNAAENVPGVPLTL